MPWLSWARQEAVLQRPVLPLCFRSKNHKTSPNTLSLIKILNIQPEVLLSRKPIQASEWYWENVVFQIFDLKCGSAA